MKAYAKAATSNEIRDQLIVENVEVAKRIALRVARRVPEWLSPDDLIAAATVGLAEAADRYDPSRGEPFIAFAEKRIRGAVLDELRRGDIMPRRVRARAREVGEAMRKLEQSLGRPPEDEEVAAELGVDPEEYRESLAHLTHVSIVDIESEGARREADNLGTDEMPHAITEKRELITLIRDGLKQLPERDALILSLYYNEQFTYAEIGDLLSVSESRVCQLHGRALARLRAAVGE